ncbi:TIGR01459 family HAD-type hydrolase [Inquilinus limosus]|uniref:TIGR01459 family HAD-type hydrolase n=1 Tax=Inquilinus limosus TaxID=171674 RepID=UPI003F16CC0D
MPVIERVEGIGALAERFSTFFVDQYGVLHDGRHPYPGAAAALRRLKEAGRHVVLLSNSGRSAAYNARRMETLGFARDSYDHFVTSGDVALALLESGALPVSPGSGARCLVISSGEDRGFAETLGFAEAETGDAADLVLIAGSRGHLVPLETYRELLAPAAARGVPALCTNPDKIMLTPLGPAFGAGRIAEMYEGLGGSVTWVGKPHPLMYHHAAATAGVERPEQVLCVGDSVEHDVAGARSFGAAAALVRTGIHAGMGEDEMAREFQAVGCTPDILLPSFRW